MYDMIKEIPASFGAAMRQASELEVPRRERLVFTGNGTAFYSAWVGSQVLKGLEIPHDVIQSFELEHYDKPTRGDLVVGVSHSGITKSTVDSLRVAKSSGSYTVGVTHFGSRPIEQVCDVVAVIGNGPDKSRCHTKTYVDSAGAVAEIALKEAELHRNDVRELRRTLGRLGVEMQNVIRRSEPWARKLVDDLPTLRQVVFAAAGPNIVSAREAALKIKESSYLPSEGVELEEEMHGPWVDLDSSSLLVVIAPPGPSIGRTRDILEAAGKTGATRVVLGEPNLPSEYDFMLPEVSEQLSPFLAILPLYLVAYFLAMKLGHNPDYLRYLEPAYWEARKVIFPPGTH